MNTKQPYRKWVGIILGIVMPGSAHFLSGKRAVGLKWYLGIAGCGLLGIGLIAVPGISPYIIGMILLTASLVLWFVMLKQSYRPVRRIGFWGWIALIVLATAMKHAQIFVVRQFILPFKIPTSAMQPTIYGITGYDMQPDSPDRPGIFQIIFSGQCFHELKSVNDGILSFQNPSPNNHSKLIYNVGAQPYELPRYVAQQMTLGKHISIGETLWSGVITAGDHIFVERLSYRFSEPKRGDIVVFKTDGIKSLQQGTVYIKRIAGLPGDHIRIDPPFLVVNDIKILEPEIFTTISSKADGYAGFQLGGSLSSSELEWIMEKDEYFVLGDNTTNSRDSRYWGPVPAKNIEGKVTRIYWPFSRINALQQ